MKSTWFRAATALTVASLLISACSSASASGGPSQSVLSNTQAPSNAPNGSGADATGVPTNLDPCTLVTASEASTLSGGSFADGSGKEETTSGNGRICTYGAQTLNVFEVILAVAPDVATAQAAEAQFLQQVQTETGDTGVTPQPVSGLGDAADFISDSYSLSGQTFNISGIYVLKGTVFFAITDLQLNHATPDVGQMTAQAQVVISRL